MFTGIIEHVAPVAAIAHSLGGSRLSVGLGPLAEGVRIGDSIACDGVCLTVAALAGTRAEFAVGAETRRKTLIGGWHAGRAVNLERALRLGDRLGGHLVAGHVDGTGTVAQFEAVGDNRRLVIEVPAAIARYIARKGSIAVDGVSLTVNAVDGDWFEVNLIAHTLAATTLQYLQPGARVNLEVDLLARYIERLREAGTAGKQQPPLSNTI